MDLRFGNYWLQVSVDDLVINFDGIDCALQLAWSDGDHAILGNAFLRNFYIIYDMEKQRMSFASLKNKDPKPDPAKGDKPEESYQDYEGYYEPWRPITLKEIWAIVVAIWQSSYYVRALIIIVAYGLLFFIWWALGWWPFNVKKNDESQPVSNLTVFEASTPSSGSELNLAAKVLIKRLLKVNQPSREI